MTAQQRFEQNYITSSEICNLLGVTRPAIHFRRKAGLLPEAIQVYGQQLLIWEREQIKPFLVEWDLSLKAKRGLTA